MARTMHSRAQQQVEVFDDHTASIGSGHHSINHDNTASQHIFDVLGDVDVNTSQLPPSTPTFTLDSLATDLKKLHLKDSPQKHHSDFQPAKPLVRGRRGRSSIDTESFEPLEAVQEEAELKETQSFATVNSQGSDQPEQYSATRQDLGSADLDCNRLSSSSQFQAAIAKHQAATPLVGDEDLVDNEPSILAEEPNMAISQTAAVASLDVAACKAPEVVKIVEPDAETSPTTPLGRSDSRISPSPVFEVMKSFATHTPPRPASASVSRIEDSVEALDKLEEELEALDAATHIQRVVSPEKRRAQKASGELPTTGKPTINRAASTTRRPAGKAQPSTVRAKPTGAARPSVRKSTSMIFSIEDGVRDATRFTEDKVLTKEAPKKFTVTRPASLLPPKPPAKSTKAPTKSTFELPGEAVARRLKEQREARLSMQINGEKPPVASTPQRTKSTRAPTRPNFELPGEAISRRKREEREAKLKQQDEEERQRREFKARPNRSSIVPNNFPRETISSRARQSRIVSDENMPKRASSVGAKRLSVLGAQSEALATSATNKASHVRGRGAAQIPSVQESRATSTSTGSISGQRSTLSAEEAQQQKLKGREIFQRDNSYTGEREREKRERELAAKIAREQAAERSRQASREWAEKQRQKQLTAVAGMASQAS